MYSNAHVFIGYTSCIIGSVQLRLRGIEIPTHDKIIMDSLNTTI